MTFSLPVTGWRIELDDVFDAGLWSIGLGRAAMIARHIDAGGVFNGMTAVDSGLPQIAGVGLACP